MKTALGGLVIVLVVISAYFLLGNKGTPGFQDNSDQPSVSDRASNTEGYGGRVLAGTSTPFIEFNQADYEKALSEGKLVLLDFYATWCPICRTEEPEMFAGFEELNNKNVVGFRVNFNDQDTDPAEKALAAKLNVPYQHTKVIIKNGQEVARFTDQWTKEDLITEVNKVL